MTYFLTQPWLSHHMNLFDMPSITSIWTKMSVQESTWVHYASAYTNHVTRHLKGFLHVGLVLPVVSLFLMFVYHRESWTAVPIFWIASLYAGSMPCIVCCVWVNGPLVYVRDTQCHTKLLMRPLIVQQVKHFGLVLSPAFYSLGFF